MPPRPSCHGAAKRHGPFQRGYSARAARIIAAAFRAVASVALVVRGLGTTDKVSVHVLPRGQATTIKSPR